MLSQLHKRTCDAARAHCLGTAAQVHAESCWQHEMWVGAALQAAGDERRLYRRSHVRCRVRRTPCGPACQVHTRTRLQPAAFRPFHCVDCFLQRRFSAMLPASQGCWGRPKQCLATAAGQFLNIAHRVIGTACAGVLDGLPPTTTATMMMRRKGGRPAVAGCRLRRQGSRTAGRRDFLTVHLLLAGSSAPAPARAWALNAWLSCQQSALKQPERRDQTTCARSSCAGPGGQTPRPNAAGEAKVAFLYADGPQVRRRHPLPRHLSILPRAGPGLSPVC